MEASATTRYAGTLPIFRTGLIGREAERAVARALLLDEAVPLLTLTGPGGVGKTRLAVAVARDVVTQFADGAVFIDLSSLRANELVAQTVAGVLGVVAGVDQTVEGAIIAFLGPGQYLLVLDNCEHVLPTVAALASTLLATCPMLQIVATSRAPLRVHGEQIFPVPALAVPPASATALDDVRIAPAAALFAQRARAADPTFSVTAQNVRAVAEICRRLDGLPLALELVAARSALLTPEAIADFLRERLPIPETGPRDTTPRQQTMSVTIAWSFEILPSDVQATFKQLAIFAGSWTLEAAGAVIALPTALVLDHPVVLAEQSLIIRHTGTDEQSLRFSMLETIRTFGLEQLHGSPEEPTARTRHAVYFRDLAATLDLAQAFPGDPSWLVLVSLDQDNFRQALDQFLAQGDIRSVTELSIALAPFWLSRSLFSEGRRWLELVIDGDSDLPIALRARVRDAAGVFLNYHGDTTLAAPILEEAVAMARECGDLPLLRDTLQSLGLAKLLQHDFSRAMAHFTESEQVARAVAPTASKARLFLGASIYLQGLAAQRSGDNATALERFLSAIPHLKTPGGNRRLGMTLGEIGVVQLYAGSLSEATSSLIEAIARIWSVRDDMALTRYLRGLAVLTATQQPVTAAQLLGAADALDARTPYNQVAGARDHDLVSQCLVRLDLSISRDALQHERRVGAGLGVDHVVALARVAAASEIGEVHVEDIWQEVRAPNPGPFAITSTPHANSSSAQAVTRFGLTQREQDVLALLGKRLTNAEIADHLFIAQSTVATHVTNLLGKLGAANRREATAIAMRHGLI